MSVVVEPEAFSRACFDVPEYKLQVELFLKGIISNGLLITDEGDVLLREMSRHLETLPTSCGQRISTIFTDLVKEYKNESELRKKIVACPALPPPQHAAENLSLAARLADAYRADALAASTSNVCPSRNRTDPLELTHYQESQFEEKRRYFRESFPLVNEIGRDGLKDALIRSMRFSRWLRFYDKEIGKGNNTPGFRKGLSFIVGLWARHAQFRKEVVEIFTLDGGTTKGYLEDKLVKPLRRDHHLDVRLEMKRSEGSDFHERYMQTETAVLKFGRGFDLFDRDGNLKENAIEIRDTDHEHLSKWRQLSE